MKIKFISLMDVLESVRKCVPIPENLEGTWQALMPIEQTSILYGIALLIYNNAMESAYQHSYAAGALDACIYNAGNSAPNWYEYNRYGWPKISSSAKSESTKILTYMSNWHARCCDAVKLQQLAPGGPGSKGPHDYQYETINDYKTLSRIGFDKKEIISFLNENEIKHNLSKEATINLIQSKNNDTTSAHLSYVTENEAAQPQDSILALTKKIDEAPKASTREISFNEKTRVNQLDPLIDLAIKNANSIKAAAVFNALKDIALNSTPPFTGEIHDNGDLVYTDANSNKARSFSKKALDNRLRRRFISQK